MPQIHAHKNVKTNGLVFALDAKNPRQPNSYALDLVGGVTGSYVNGIDRDSNNQIWEFDGVDDYIQYDGINIGEVHTIDIWCYMNNKGGILMGEGVSGDNYYHYVPTSGSPRFVIAPDGSSVSFFSDDIIVDRWMHVVLIRNGVTCECFLDGVSLGVETLVGSSAYILETIGGDYPHNSGFLWDGNISQVKIYNRVLTSDEVKFNYESTKKYFTSAEVRDSLVLELNSRYPLTIDEGNNTWTSRVGGLVGSMESDASYDGLDMDFDGTDDNVNFGDILDMGLNSYTLEAWVYLKGNNTSNDWLISKSFANVGNYRWGLGLAGTNQLYPLVVGSGNTIVLPTGVTSLNLNTWYMINMVIDRSANILLYINGESESYTGSGNISAFSAQDFQTTHPLRIGAYTAADNTSPTNASNTKIPIVKIYNRVLTADEVLRNYNFNKHRFN